MESKPEIHAYVEEYLSAFSVLSPRRTIGFSGENPISMSDIVAYLSMYPTSDVDLFLYLIAQMDHEYLSIRAKKSEQ